MESPASRRVHSVAGPMTALELARWQFGITTLYHFIFVPVTIGLAICVAFFQTRWYRTGEEHWLRSTRFWGKLMLISFALGVATGIVQEFQFGMNWSNYSRFVGDIFGAPLAMEGLAAFFVESTFLGLWIFGWGRLSKKVHLACAWLVAGSTALSAYFILAANSWMQHPVGYKMADGKAELTNIASVLFNNTALYAFAHTILAALLTAGMILIAVSAWHLRQGSETEVFGGAMRLALPLVTLAAIATVIVGHFNGILMSHQQPMKMAAADAVFETKKGAGLSLFATGDFKSNPEGLNRNVEIPNLLSWIIDRLPARRDRGDQQPQPRIPAASTAPATTRRSSPSPTGPGGRCSAAPSRCWPSPPGAGGCCAKASCATRSGSCGSRCPPSPCRSSPAPPAGSSPRWAASPGSSSAC